ncbi:nucleotide exchange factor GrpE [Thiolapillus sp.]|uniref:nucleotide exchange factor GrpE n=1 Tax=Thiolapillus sp. TaxID=2017437 RepID=UPI0025FEAACD|nr:nucleotide exchange factor GrpE [Thiolapillus sp.]
MDKEQEYSDEELTETPENKASGNGEDLSHEELGRLLEDVRSKADEHWDQVVRTRAEMDNLKKRHQRELENAHKYGLEKFVGELLGVRDSLELGFNAAQENHDVEKLLEGTELTLKMLADAMNKFGVEQIDPEGEPFNPELHQAMGMVPTNDVPPNTVVNVVQKGYLLNGRLVRPAMVMVSQAA